ncbi:MAG TPA: dTMP kinase, partial [Chloroflexota bacterium]|nr:dTMP kinase [Chloroflexota bacterium]
GKTSHARTLAAALRATGRAVTETREPGGTPAGTAIRSLLLGAEATPLTALAELFLYCADRTEHVTEVIRPALAAGTVVVCDRYSDSTLAYQGFGRGVDLASLETLVRFATGGLQPHLTILINLDVRLGLERKRRASQAGEDDLNRIDLRDVPYHQRVRDGFLTLAAREPERFFVVDGASPPEALADEIWGRVRRLVGLQAETPRLL